MAERFASDALTQVTGGTTRRPLRLSDGDTVVSPSLDELKVKGTLVPINLDAQRKESPARSPVWTATRPNGAKHNEGQTRAPTGRRPRATERSGSSSIARTAAAPPPPTGRSMRTEAWCGAAFKRRQRPPKAAPRDERSRRRPPASGSVGSCADGGSCSRRDRARSPPSREGAWRSDAAPGTRRESGH